jgi:4-amino-4-deoxy-L-arabinose transferase-like glycosyltransferase
MWKQPMRRISGLVCAAVVAAIANVVLWLDMPELLQAGAALSIAVLVPGALLVAWWAQGLEAPPEKWEQFLYAVGAGFGLLIAMLLFLSYLPGGLARVHVLLAFDLLVAFLLAGVYLGKRQRQAVQRRVESAHAPARSGYVWGVAAGALLLLVVILRFMNLGYSDFQGDEAGVALRANEVLIGYENALFVHTKGPAEILIASAIYALTGRLTEAGARLPFALANTCAVLAMLALGRRMFGLYAGWLAALLLALDGYLIAFGRILQYQSIVFLSILLGVLALYQAVQTPEGVARRLYLSALLLATGLLAHYEAALAALPVLYLTGCLWARIGPARLARAIAGPAVLGLVLLSAFYAPFVRNPEFSDTMAYVLGFRIAGDSAPETLSEVINRTTLYSSTYYLIFLFAVALAGVAAVDLRVQPRLLGWIALAASAAWIIGLAVAPDLFVWNGRNLAGWALLALLFVIWTRGRLRLEERMVWIWFGGALTLGLFFAARPGTHVYGIFIPWALLAGMLGQQLFDGLTRRFGAAKAATAGVVAGLILAAVFAPYEYWMFVQHDVEALRAWPEARLPGYWTPYAEPVENAIFGFPLANGWKAGAVLLDQGVLQRPFDTNARAAIANWYTRGQGYCPRDDPESYFLAQWVEPTLRDEHDDMRRQVEEDYGLQGYTTVEGAPHAELYIDDDVDSPTAYAEETYEERYVRELGGVFFPENGRTGVAPIANPRSLRFGQTVELAGFDVDRLSAAQGDDVKITLYWRALAPMERNYDVSVQIVDLVSSGKAGQRDGAPGCNLYPTSTWIPGDLMADTYRLSIDGDAALGRYSLYVTMYGEDGGLAVMDGEGRALGTGVVLSEFEVMEQ